MNRAGKQCLTPYASCLFGDAELSFSYCTQYIQLYSHQRMAISSQMLGSGAEGRAHVPLAAPVQI